LTRHDSHVAQQMVERAAELARDSHARTRHAAVLVKDGSLLACGTNGVPFPGEDHCYCKSPNRAIMTSAGPARSNGRSRWPVKAMAGGCCRGRS
jgi:deoxycytidylate deaminase